MKRPVSVALWYFSYISIACLIVYLTVPCLPLTWLPKDSLAWRLLEFEHRLARFRSSPDKPRTVIIGPSYAQQLGEIGDHVYNISFVGVNPAETDYLLSKYCRRDDRIFLFCSLRDMAILDEEPRSIIVSSIRRRWIILKRTLNRPAVADTMFLDGEVLAAHLKAVFSLTEADINLAWYRRLNRRYPAMVFIIQPLLNPAEPSGHAAAKFRLSLRDFRSIDLLEHVRPSMMKDPFHLNEEGVELVRKGVFQSS